MFNLDDYRLFNKIKIIMFVSLVINEAKNNQTVAHHFIDYFRQGRLLHSLLLFH